MFNFTSLPPLSLYVHLPWCARKCPYCDFNSHQARAAIPEADYVAALIADLEHDLPRVWGRPVRSIFIGGGTPSLFSPAAIDGLLSGIHARLPVMPDAEITLEANPGTSDTERFKGFRDAGVNRLSIGIQSFDDQKLKALGRIHDRGQALRAAEAARAAGFDNVNLDLMFGLPGQTVDQALADLRTAIAQQPAHLSVYQLTIEPNTLFHARPPTLPDDDILWAMQEQLQALLAANGYRQYEVSAYARAGHECRHNLNYWIFGDYLGIGAGAHAKLTDAGGGPQGRGSAAGSTTPGEDDSKDGGGRAVSGTAAEEVEPRREQRPGMPGAAITRLWKVKQPKDYLIRASGLDVIGGEQRLTEREAGLEFMLNALRLTNGFNASLFEERTGLSLDAVQAPLARARSLGLIAWERNTIRPTERGQRFLNDLAALFD